MQDSSRHIKKMREKSLGDTKKVKFPLIYLRERKFLQNYKRRANEPL